MSEFPDWMLHFAHVETAKRHGREAVTEHYRKRLLVDESPKFGDRGGVSDHHVPRLVDESRTFNTGFSAGKAAVIRYLKRKADE